MDNRNPIVFNSLSYGTHKLLIRKLNGFGNPGIIYHSIIINVSPYYYQSWWFLILLVIITVALIYLVYKTRANILIQRNEILELRIEAQTYVLKENISKLKASQYELNEKTIFQENLLASLTHDLKSPLKFMMHLGKRIYEKLPPDSKAKEGLMGIYLSSNQMYHFTDNLINYSRHFLNKGELTIERLSLISLVKDKESIFSEIASYQKTAISIQVSPITYLETDKTLLSVILHNLIDNAIKFCQGGTILISSFQSTEGILLTISDTGCGMSSEILNWMNDCTAQTASKGLGLKMVREFATKLNIKIHFESSPTNGTKISMFFPS